MRWRKSKLVLFFFILVDRNFLRSATAPLKSSSKKRICEKSVLPVHKPHLSRVVVLKKYLMASYSPCQYDHFQLFFFFAVGQLVMKIWRIFIYITFGLLHWAASDWHKNLHVCLFHCVITPLGKDPHVKRKWR